MYAAPWCEAVIAHKMTLKGVSQQGGLAFV